MKLENFAYWLQGFFELSGTDELTPEQVRTIKNHLNLVFKHDIDPKMGDAEKQKLLNAVHSPGKDLVMRC